ncbi:unnamed protein product [Cuscuta campestris]|uniref:Chalcone-flavonone isomerase family protein n=1 Tax=Cuscuta campestris TaxID=132261 RepID=A0A484MQC2_9ASTE|nr:unnamed protein product [Cuscuta campestris]
MSAPPSVTEIEVEGNVFPATVTPPGSAKAFILGGAGERGLNLDGKFVKFTAIGVYLEADAVSSLAVKWNGKSPDELTDSVEFYRDLVTGPFEKLTQIRMILPLSGKQYSEKVTENCIAHWKELGIYGDAEIDAIDKFLQVFSDQMFPPAASILFSHSHSGSLTISFSKDGAIPKTPNAVIENKNLSEAVLESIIGVNGVSPAAKRSLALRLSELLKKGKDIGEENV